MVMRKRSGLQMDEPAAGRSTVVAAFSRPSADLREVPIAAIATNPDNPDERIEVGESLLQLVASLRAIGMLQPVTLVPVGVWLAQSPHHEFAAGIEYVAVDGNRRLVASGIAELSTVPAFVREDVAGQDAEVMLHANMLRLELTPLEEAVAYQRLVDEKAMTQRTIADRLGVSQGTVSKRLALLGLPDVVQEAVGRGTVAPSDALSVADAYKATPEVLEGITRDDLDTASLKSAANTVQRRLNRERATAAAVQDATKRGVEFVDDLDARFGYSWRQRQLHTKTEIAAAQKAGHLVLGIAGYHDYAAVYLSSAPRPKKQASDSERAVRAARKAREAFVGTIASGSFTATELNDLLIGLVVDGQHPDSRATALACKWLTGDTSNDGKYAWHHMIHTMAKQDQQQAVWALGWATRELNQEYVRQDVKRKYLKDLQRRGYEAPAAAQTTTEEGSDDE